MDRQTQWRVGITSAVVFVGMSLLGDPAIAGVKEGVEAYKKADYEAALGELQPAAFAGGSKAAYYLGMMYERGEGVRRSNSTAWGWYQKAAAKHPDAQYRIGLMYQKGLGVPLKPKDALKWHLKAAKKDHRRAMVAAGMIYLHGRGVRPDLIKAQQWLEKAASLGDPDAQVVLDRLAAEGRIKRLPPEGEPNPKDAELLKVLADVNLMIKPYRDGTVGTRMDLGAAPRIKRDGKGTFIVFLPDVKLYGQGGDGPTLMGTIRLGLKPAGKDQYQIDVQLPSVFTMTDAAGQPKTTVTMGDQKVSFLWSMPLGTALQGDAKYSDIKFHENDGSMDVGITSAHLRLVTTETAAKLMDAKETLVLEGLSIRSSLSPGDNLDLASLSLEGGVSGFDLNGYLAFLTQLGIDWRAGKVPPDVVEKILGWEDEIPILFSGVSFSTQIKGVNIAGVKVQSGDIGVSINDLNTDNAWVHLSLGLKQLEAPGMQVMAPVELPQSVSAAVTVSGIPAKELFGQMLTLLRETKAKNPGLASGKSSSVPLPMETLSKAFDMPSVQVRIDEALVVGTTYDIKITGALKTLPDADPPAVEGTFLVAVRGLDVLLKGQPDKRLLEIANISEDANGRTVYSFNVEVTPKGDIVVNGTSSDDLFVNPK